MARVEVHRATFQRETQKAARRWADRVGHDVVNEAKRRCPVDEGALRASITHVAKVETSTATVVVGSPLPYAECVHEGTGLYGPHHTPIVPVTREFLKFKPKNPAASKDKRSYIFRRSVKGQKPQPFLADALRAVMGTIRTRTK